MFVGHVAVVTEVVVVTLGTLPANTTHSSITTLVTIDVPVAHT